MFYSYKCPNCEKTHTIRQGMNDSHEYQCPECSVTCKREWNPTPFRFEFFYGYDEGLGKYMDTKKQRDNFMREKGFRFA